jgi:hypothetical protein
MATYDPDYHDLPFPSAETVRQAGAEPSGLDFTLKAKKWRPKGATMEESTSSTVSRFAHRVIKRDGTALTADELLDGSNITDPEEFRENIELNTKLFTARPSEMQRFVAGTPAIPGVPAIPGTPEVTPQPATNALLTLTFPPGVYNGTLTIEGAGFTYSFTLPVGDHTAAQAVTLINNGWADGLTESVDIIDSYDNVIEFYVIDPGVGGNSFTGSFTGTDALPTFSEAFETVLGTSNGTFAGGAAATSGTPAVPEIPAIPEVPAGPDTLADPELLRDYVGQLGIYQNEIWQSVAADQWVLVYPTLIATVATANHTLNINNRYGYTRFTAGVAKTLTIPQVDESFPVLAGDVFSVRNAEVGDITIVPVNISVTLNHAPDGDVITPSTTAQLIYLGDNNWDIL